MSEYKADLYKWAEKQRQFRKDFRQFAENAIAEELPDTDVEEKTEEQLLQMLRAVSDMKSLYETNNNSSSYSPPYSPSRKSSDRNSLFNETFTMRFPQDMPLGKGN
jgi:hypothetical protein